MELQSVGSQRQETLECFIECPICLQSLNEECDSPLALRASVREAPLVVEVGCQGKHRYHETCFRSWVAASARSSVVTTCPSCRDPVYEVRLLMQGDDEIHSVVPKYVRCRQCVYVMMCVAQIAWIFLMLYSMDEVAT
jgi:hypothetical protein